MGKTILVEELSRRLMEEGIPESLAARKVNPDVEVKVVWVNTWFDPGKESDAAKTLIDQGAELVELEDVLGRLLLADDQRGHPIGDRPHQHPDRGDDLHPGAHRRTASSPQRSGLLAANPDQVSEISQHVRRLGP